MADDIMARIAVGLNKPGKNKIGLAKALGVHPSQVTRILQGKRPIKLDELPKITTYLDDESMSVPDQPGHEGYRLSFTHGRLQGNFDLSSMDEAQEMLAAITAWLKAHK